MKVVIDTNVVVSAMLRQGTPPAAVVDALLRGELTILYDQRILDEYREVLARPKFGFDSGNVDALLRFVTSAGLLVPDAAFPHALPDPDDQPFADVICTSCSGRAAFTRARSARTRSRSTTRRGP